MGEEGCHRLRCGRRGARASFLPGSGTGTRRKQVNNLAIAASERAPSEHAPWPREERAGATLRCRFVQSAMRRRTMKYVCFGYYDKGKFELMTESERNAMFDTCFEYDDHLRASGHWGGGEALQGPETALTLSWKNGKVETTDGPYAETKEQHGGILILEARDMNHAHQLISQHPALKYGAIFEIRPAGDLNEMLKASEQRRQKTVRSAK